MQKEYAKILLVSRGVWDDNKGTSSTLSNLFQNYNPNLLKQIYIETKTPNTKLCNNFFQISEYSLIRKLFNKKVVTGKEININNDNRPVCLSKDSIKEKKIMNFVKQNRLWLFTYLREILWLLNGWKSKEFKTYLSNIDSEVLFLDGSSLILMNRLHNYVIRKTKKPATIFLMDDVYTYKSCKNNIMAYCYKFFLRLSVKRVVKNCKEVFVASPKMKKEYDTIFNINSKFLTKGINYTQKKYIEKKIHTPIKIVYLGQIIYGRVYSLITMARTLSKLNANGVKAQLYIYTGNFISDKIRKKLELDNSSFIMDSVPYNQIQQIMDNVDIVLFVESLKNKYKNIARLSFSTKITDYLSSGNCIFAIGDKNVAPIEYLKENDAAIIANCEIEIEKKIKYLIENPNIIIEYAKKSFDCGKRNHDIDKINSLLYKTIHDTKKN